MSRPPQSRGGRGRRRTRDGSLVMISWRDIPAQVNAGAGDDRVQRILPRRFQKAIDRAAMVAGKTQASEYVGEWRRSVITGDPADPAAAAVAAAAQLEDAFPRERLAEFVKTGGWDPSRPVPTDSDDAAVSTGEETNVTRTAVGSPTTEAGAP